MENLTIKSFRLALKMSGISVDKNTLKRDLIRLKTYDDIIKINMNCNHYLYPWVPALVFDILGYDSYRDCSLNIDSSSTFLLFRPGEDIDEILIELINKTGLIVIEKNIYLFTKKLVSLLYGGFPWFNAYCSTCNRLSLWNTEGYAYKIVSTDNSPCVKRIVDLKNKYREQHKNKTIIFNLPESEGLGFSGIIHSFHCPNCIENVRHCAAIADSII